MTPATSDLDLATWTQPGTSFSITYRLALFHEIDFQVNEGYRSIPYGGIEIGGLLFGHADRNSARIEAFRTIECEHASGPSFVLSDHDISVLQQQLNSSAGDPELAGLKPIGWFISHTRKGLQMNDRESALFDQLFPEPGAITLLVKPERFKPTLFGFLLRDREGTLQRDATGQAIILPLSGRAGQAPLPAVPAAAEKSIETPVPPPAPEPLIDVPLFPSSEPPAIEESPAESVRETFSEGPAPAAIVPTVIPEPPEPEPPQFEWPKREPPEPEPPFQQWAPTPARPVVPDFVPEGVTSLAPRPRRPENPYTPLFDARVAHDQITRRIRQESTRSNASLILVLFLAAALGCAVGYWAYLQLPSATIALTLRSQPSALIVSWPAQQTRDAVYAAIRVDDSEPRALPLADKASGQTEVSVTGDNVKIELIAQHWMRDSRGIVRYVRAVKPVPEPFAINPAAREFRRRRGR